MKRRTWIILAVLVGVGLAILVGVAGATSQETPAQAQQSLCSSLGSLKTATSNLTSLDPKTASKSDYQSAVSDIDDAWDDVTSDAQDVKTADTNALSGAWNDFNQAVHSVPSDASVSDALQSVSKSAQQLVSTTQSTINTDGCA